MEFHQQERKLGLLDHVRNQSVKDNGTNKGLSRRNLFKMLLLSEIGMVVGYNMFIFNPIGDIVLENVYGLIGAILRSAMGDVNLLFSTGSMIACLITAGLANKYGRLKLIYIYQVLIILTLGLYWIENLYVLYFVRFLIGFVSAGQQTVSCVMLKELLSKESSGIGNSMIYTYLGTFIFFAYIQGNLHSTESIIQNWRYILCWPIIPEFIKLIILPCSLPFDSPKYFYLNYKESFDIEYKMASIYIDTHRESQVVNVIKETIKVVKDEDANTRRASMAF